MKNLTIYAVAAAVLAIAPTTLIGADKNPTPEPTVNTEAGSIRFDLLKQYEVMPFMKQAITSSDATKGLFELGNGSQWSASDINALQGWEEGDEIVLAPNQALFSLHRYALLNMRLDKAVPISLLKGPRPDALYIAKIDLANDIITLNDDKQWSVDRQDHGTLKRLSEHDPVLIGLNASDYCERDKTMGYMIMDTTTQQWVRVTPLNR